MIKFNHFKKSYAIDDVVSDLKDNVKESKAFEYFVNHTLLSIDYPDIFVGNFDLLDNISVGGGNDTGIDGIGITPDHVVQNEYRNGIITKSTKAY